MQSFSHEGFESFYHNFRMSLKMVLIIFGVVATLQIAIGLSTSIIKVSVPTMKVILSYGLAKLYCSFNPAHKITFTNPNGLIVETTAEAIVNSPAISSYIKEKIGIFTAIFLRSCLVYLLIPVTLYFFKNLSVKQIQKKHIRGSKFISKEMLITTFRKKKIKTDLIFAGLPMPVNLENRVSLVLGRPGVGKTQLIFQMLDGIIKREDSCIIYDAKGDFTENFYNPEAGDIILNPLDQRSVGWCLFNEIKTKLDIEAVAASLIPEAQSANGKFWADSARTVFSSILAYLYGEKSQPANRDIWNNLIGQGGSLYHNLAGKKGQIYIQAPEANQTLGTMSTLIQHTAVFEYLVNITGDFSISNWVENGSGRIFITNNAECEDVLKPILSLFVDLLARKILSLPDSTSRRLFFLLDEFPTLNKLPSLGHLINLSRSKGVGLIIGAQSESLIDQIYSESWRKATTNAIGNYAIFSVQDASSKFASDLIGESEIKRAERSLSMGVDSLKDGKNIQYRTEKKLLMLPSEISSLPELHCVAKFSGFDPVMTQVEYKEYNKSHPAFVMRDDLKLSLEKEQAPKTKYRPHGGWPSGATAKE